MFAPAEKQIQRFNPFLIRAYLSTEKGQASDAFKRAAFQSLFNQGIPLNPTPLKAACQAGQKHKKRRPPLIFADPLPHFY